MHILCLAVIFMCSFSTKVNALVDATTGFAKVVGLDSIIISPDLARKNEFRTSQLAVVDGVVWPSRKVLYRSTRSEPLLATVVVPIDANEDAEQLAAIISAQKRFCQKHHYGLFIRYVQDFALLDRPRWESLRLAELRMLRQAMLAFPHSQWFWMLNGDERMKPQGNLPIAHPVEFQKAIRDTARRESIRISNLATSVEKVEIVATANVTTGDISSSALILNNSITSKAFVEFATDPVFQNWLPADESAETDSISHTLTHILHWHPIFVGATALLPPGLVF